MHPPCEMMMDKFLPAMRVLVARKLSKEGFSQGKIASMLGVTQASVSLYLSGDLNKVSNMISDLGIYADEADQYSSLLAEDVKKNPVYAVSTLYSIWNDLLGKGLMCLSHRRDYPFLTQCDVCLRTFGPQQVKSSDAIDHVSQAVSIIESSNLFVKIMPQISVNIVYAYGDAKSINDIIAIPGRIVKVRNKPKSFMKPEFGASSHLAKILLLARFGRKDFSAAINLRYDEKMGRVLKKLRLNILTIGGAYPKGVDDPVVEVLREKIGETEKRFDVIIDLGGSGFEPSLYLFAKDAVECAKQAIKIAKMYTSYL
jgi:predicted fused transcriptional regulator/phosphomethylpyrimidine kinase/predicted transcriptional regulator